MIQRVTIPIVSDLTRIRSGFLMSTLSSLFSNSHIEHEVILVSNDGDKNEFRELVSQYPITIVPIDYPFVIPNCGGHLYKWLNLGAVTGSTNWILTPAGDDSYFFAGWERLIEALEGYNPELTISTPSILETNSAQHNHMVHGRTMEIRIGWSNTPMTQSELLHLYNLHIHNQGTLTESPKDRIIAHWAHTLQHKNLFLRAGKFKEDPPWPAANDLDLHDTYSELGVTKLCVSDSCIGNCRMPVSL